MKIGIITFHNGSNYGAALQTLALQEAIKKRNQKVQVINYKNRFIMQGLDKIRFKWSIRGVYFLLTDICNYRVNKKKISRFREFFKRYDCTKLLNKQELKQEDLDFDVIVSGSDQIWNPLLDSGYDDIYFGCICNAKKKVSYGSSIGNYRLNDEKLNEELRKLLLDYDCISVRENAQDISKVIGREVVDVCDPTILLDKNEWKELLELRKKDDKYLLVYCLSDFTRVIEYAKKVAEEKKLSVYYIGDAFKKVKDVCYIRDIGPREFVELFYNASYIVTNSFHGTAFAVNFEKQFVSLRHPKSPERAVAFLERVDLKERLVENGQLLADMRTEDNKRGLDGLKKMRNGGYEYLKAIID